MAISSARWHREGGWSDFRKWIASLDPSLQPEMAGLRDLGRSGNLQALHKEIRRPLRTTKPDWGVRDTARRPLAIGVGAPDTMILAIGDGIGEDDGTPADNEDDPPASQHSSAAKRSPAARKAALMRNHRQAAVKAAVTRKRRCR
jgi:hypothetical protein